MFIYTVKSGDTLNGISSMFGVPVKKIATDNTLLSPSRLAVGQSLVIMSDERRYVLREGQTLFSVASGDPVFAKVLDKFFSGRQDTKTLSILGL